MRLSTNQARTLMTIGNKADLETWLVSVAGTSVFHDESWRLVGGMRSNAGPIEQSADEINPLVERVVNGIEAVIELRVKESGVIPATPKDAIETLFQVPQGRARLLDDGGARRLAQNVVVTFRGERRADEMTIAVRDHGLGIHPSDFANTILSLGQSDKGQKPYLIGMYGQGGSSTFDKCEYTIIVSRCHQQHLAPDSSDSIGWTVVRRNLNVRAPVYTYLIDPDTQDVPFFPGSIGEQIDMSHGTAIVHVGYRNLGSFASQQMTNYAFYTLNYRLFDPLLPWTLTDSRQGIHESRTMRGIPYRVNELPETTGIGSVQARRRSDATAVRDHTEYQHRLQSGSTLKVEWWILQDEQVLDGHRRREHTERVRPYRDPGRRFGRRVIVITRGGQTHAALTTTETFNSRRLRMVGRSIIVQVDTDDMTWEEGASFFASSRTDLKAASQNQIEEAVNAAIDLSIDRLRAIERERQAEIVSGRSASDEATIRRHLDPMIQAFRRTMQTRGAASNVARRSGPEWRGLQTPTYLRFARTSTLELQPGVRTHLELLTDAADEVFQSPRTTRRIESDPPALTIGQPRGGSGRWRVDVFPSTDLPVGSHIEVAASISQQDTWYLRADPSCQALVVEPPSPYQGNYPPTFLRFRSRGEPVQVRQGGSSIAIESDATDNIMLSGANFAINLPESNALSLGGLTGPRRGQFRARIQAADDTSLGGVGEIIASLTLADGTAIEDIASLVITPRLSEGGREDIASQPNYDIKDVRELPLEDGVHSWAAMPTILEGSEPWTGEDVGAYYETGDEAYRHITFYLNADNRELQEAENRLARLGSPAMVDTFREMHRTLLCFHLYRIATTVSPTRDADYAYRQEMIRVSQTLLYTRREFLEQLASDENDE